MELYDRSQSYTTFTKEGTKTAVEIQNYFMNLIKSLKEKNTPEKDIEEMCLMFLKESSYKKLLKAIK